MPEVAELRRHILGYRIKSLDLPEDLLLFPQAKSAPEPAKLLAQYSTLLKNSTVQNVGRHGKYFWIRTATDDKATAVILMHFGMTGMVKMRGIESHFIMMENGGDKKVKREILMESGRDLEAPLEDKAVLPKRSRFFSGKNVKAAETRVKVNEDEVGATQVQVQSEAPRNEVLETFLNHFAAVQKTDEWPPRFTKFQLFLESSDGAIDFAFTDPRRLGRVQILSGPEYKTNRDLMENCPSLRKLGPDYSKSRNAESHPFTTGDPDPEHHGKRRLEYQDFAQLVLSKKKPIKAFLLDQEYFAGIGNWVSDEILYHARLYPGETLSLKIVDPDNAALRKLYDSIIYVMEEAVRVEGNAREFPEDWMMIHRWGKRRKHERAKLSNGHSVDFETIGGRTSCFVKELQKPLKRQSRSEEHQTKQKMVKEENDEPPKKRIVKEEKEADPARTPRRSRRTR